MSYILIYIIFIINILLFNWKLEKIDKIVNLINKRIENKNLIKKIKN